MMIFDVKCRVVDPIHVSDSSGKDVTIMPGLYHLRGLNHLVRNIANETAPSGTDLSFIREADGKAAYTVSAENLARFIARDEVEIKA